MVVTISVLISLGAFLALFAPASWLGLLQTVLVPTVILGGILLWKKPHQNWKSVPRSAYAAAILPVVALGISLRNRLLAAQIVHILSGKLRLPATLLPTLAAIVCGVCAVLFTAAILQQAKQFFAKHTHPAFLLVRNLLLCVAAAIFVVHISQVIVSIPPLSMGRPKFLWGAVIVLTLLLGMYAITGEIKVSVLVATGVFLLLAVADTYVYRFRERLIEPVDIFSLGTAMNVADNYSLLPIPKPVLRCLCYWAALMVPVYWLLPRTGLTKWKTRLALALCCLLGCTCVFRYTANLKTYHWQKEGAVYNGLILDFTAKFHEVSAKKPAGYDPGALDALSATYPGEAPDSDNKPPHIIVIMNEAFSDLGVLGELTTNEEVTPFISSLKKNTVSGYALASVYGGNTANSEYEFLTGNTMAFLSPNAVPYQQYIRNSTFSLPSYLKTTYGYRCIAMHPYLSNGWNRPEAYQQLGFDSMQFLEDFPQQDLVRVYVSDQEMTDQIIKTYQENRQQPLFLFGVTMQNHGGYNYLGISPSEISTTNLANNHFDVNQYLSLIHETDKATERLISYFQNSEERVIVVFFGDHQPKLDDAFYQDIGSTADTLEEIQDRHKIPFFIWSNYPIEEKQVECTSLNYLSNYLYEAAGLAKPAYMQFLAEMEKQIPAINANGYYSTAAKSFLPFEEASGVEKQWLELYEQLQYNCLFDKKQRSGHFFPALTQ